MSTESDVQPEPGSESFPRVVRSIARQPILDTKRRVYGYELLFRGQGTASASDDPDRATRQVIADGMLTHGLEKLTQRRKAFINFTRDTLVKAEPGFLPRERVVIEVLENVEPDTEVLAACARLRKAGYVIALDDVTTCSRVQSFPGLVDIVKVDLPFTSPREQARLVEHCQGIGAAALAEKVETYGEFEAAAAMGYRYFQGFFFGRPETQSSTAIPASKLAYLRVLKIVNAADLDREAVAGAIKSESTLCFLLLRYMNSALFSFARRVESIEHAVTILGDYGVRKWTSLLALSAMSEGKPTELAVTSLVRASWCESLDLPGLADRETRFLLGLLSLVDAVMDRPMSDVLDQLALSEELTLALVEREGALGDMLRMIEAYESGQWVEVNRLAAVLETESGDVATQYLDAVAWAHEVFAISA